MDFRAAIARLQTGRVDCIVIGGVAAALHGSARVTTDIDVLYSRADDNIDRLVRALAPLHPYLRGAPPGLPFHWNAPTVRAGLNFTLTTDLGPIDLLGEVAGVGRYETARAHATPMTVFGRETLVIDLAWLIRAKRAAGRVKDLETIAELELLQDPAIRAAAAAEPPKGSGARKRKR